MQESNPKILTDLEVGDLSGDIVRIAARSAWVRTNDNVVIIVPNPEFISNRVTNWTANDRRVRITVPLGTGYSSDPAVVREILLQIAKTQSDILDDPAPDVIFQGFGDNSLNFELRVWTEPAHFRGDLVRQIADAIVSFEPGQEAAPHSELMEPTCCRRHRFPFPIVQGGSLTVPRTKAVSFSRR